MNRDRGADVANPTRTIHFALGANVLIAIAKFTGASVTGSGAMLAEAIHSLADAGNELLLLWGRRQARAGPTPDHPRGYGRASYFWSFMVALLLFTVGGIVSIYEGVQRLHDHEGLTTPWVAIAILLMAACAEGTAQWVALRQINRLRGDKSLWRWLRETRRSELIVVFAEDAAALVGIAIALAAIAATMITGNTLYDGAGSIAVGVLLMVVACLLGIETQSLLIGESAGPRVRHAMRSFLEQRQEVAAVLEFISSQEGERVDLGIKVEMQPTMSAEELIAAVQRCEDALRRDFPQTGWVFMQPVSRRSGRDALNALNSAPRGST